MKWQTGLLNKVKLTGRTFWNACLTFWKTLREVEWVIHQQYLLSGQEQGIETFVNEHSEYGIKWNDGSQYHVHSSVPELFSSLTANKGSKTLLQVWIVMLTKPVFKRTIFVWIQYQGLVPYTTNSLFINEHRNLMLLCQTTLWNELSCIF